jgi:biopolymer transport protein ExbD
LPLTPLVDVVFLLLMFFMLTSTFAKFGRLPLTASVAQAQADVGSPRSPQRVPGIIVRVAAGAVVRINGRPVALAALGSVLDDYSAKGVATAVVVAAPGATVQDLVTVLEIGRSSRIVRFLLAG